MMQDYIIQARKGKRIHVRGISTLDALELLADYYQEKGYEDIYLKKYILPPDEPLTVSISLRHALWCEKDKHFLYKQSLHTIIPPLRTPSDLYRIQQFMRMGIIMGIDVWEDAVFLRDLFDREIITPHQVNTLISWSWKKHWFTCLSPGITVEIWAFVCSDGES
jgi:hypothetical protein